MPLIDEFQKNAKSFMDILKFLVDNKMELYSLVKHMTWEDILDGHIVLTEDIINKELVPVILKKADKFISSMEVSIKEGIVILYIKGVYNGFPFGVDYTLSFDKFEFNPLSHVIILDYDERISSFMNADKGFLVKSAKALAYAVLRRKLIEFGLHSLDGVVIDENKIVINLDGMQWFKDLYNKKLVSDLLPLTSVNLIGCSDGKIAFKVNIDINDKTEEIETVV